MGVSVSMKLYDALCLADITYKMLNGYLTFYCTAGVQIKGDSVDISMKLNDNDNDNDNR